MAVLEQAIIFLVLMIVGLYARRIKLITSENQPQISGLVVNIAYPAIILSGALTPSEKVSGQELVMAFGASLALLALVMLAGWLIVRLMKFEQSLRGIVIVMTVFTNIGFMGVPMIKGIYGTDALIYITIFLIPFNLLFFSFAVAAISGQKQQSSQPLLIRFKLFFNNGMIACFLAILFYFVDVPIPSVIRNTVDMLGSMTAPLAMILMGSFLVDVNWIDVFVDKKAILYFFLKMLVVPVVVVWILDQFIDNRVLLGVCMAAVATPCGNVIALLAAIYNKKAYPIAVKYIALSTLGCVATMPIAFTLAGLG